MRGRLIIALTLAFIGCKSDKEEGDTEEQIVISASEKRVTQDPELKESISRGAQIYISFCASCHLSNGQGIPNAFPPLNKSDWLTDKRKETIRAVKYGVKGPIEVNGVKYDNLMPDLGLTDREIVDVTNYTFNAWDNNVQPSVTVEEVEAVEK